MDSINKVVKEKPLPKQNQYSTVEGQFWHNGVGRWCFHFDVIQVTKYPAIELENNL